MPKRSRVLVVAAPRKRFRRRNAPVASRVTRQHRLALTRRGRKRRFVRKSTPAKKRFKTTKAKNMFRLAPVVSRVRGGISGSKIPYHSGSIRKGSAMVLNKIMNQKSAHQFVDPADEEFLRGPIPIVSTARLTFDDVITVALTDEAVSEVTLNMTSMIDPAAGLAAIRPTGYAALECMYDNYLVTGAKVTVDAQNLSTEDGLRIWGYMEQTELGADSTMLPLLATKVDTWDEALKANRAKTVILNANIDDNAALTYGSAKKFTFRYDPHTFLPRHATGAGQPTIGEEHDVGHVFSKQFAAAVSTKGTYDTLFTIAAQTALATQVNAVIQYSIRIEYDVMCWGLKAVNGQAT